MLPNALSCTSRSSTTMSNFDKYETRLRRCIWHLTSTKKCNSRDMTDTKGDRMPAQPQSGCQSSHPLPLPWERTPLQVNRKHVWRACKLMFARHLKDQKILSWHNEEGLWKYSLERIWKACRLRTLHPIRGYCNCLTRTYQNPSTSSNLEHWAPQTRCMYFNCNLLSEPTPHWDSSPDLPRLQSSGNSLPAWAATIRKP